MTAKPLTTADPGLALAQGQLDRAVRTAEFSRNGSRQVTAEQRQETAERGAQMFETLLVKQMFQSMRKTLPEGSTMRDGSGPGGHLYMQFVDDAVSQHLGSAGLGLRSMLVKAFGGDPERAARHRAPISLAAVGDHGHAGSVTPQGPTPNLKETLEPGPALPGATGLLQKSAAQLLQDGGAARFSKHGRLSEQDLASPLATEARDGGVATFNATASDGYHGHPKCNLFALEAARRAGYSVPVVARSKGWGFPGSDRLTHDADDGSLKGDWANVATGASAGQLDAEITSGRSAFLLVGSADGERHGHMAVVERIRDLDYDAEGNLRRVIFDGYEARNKGAMRLERRTWNLEGNRGGRGARNGFSGIELLRLERPDAGENREVTLSRSAPSTTNRNFVSRDAVGRPIADLEEER